MEPLKGQSEMEKEAPEILTPEWLELWDNNAHTAPSLDYSDPIDYTHSISWKFFIEKFLVFFHLEYNLGSLDYGCTSTSKSRSNSP